MKIEITPWKKEVCGIVYGIDWYGRKGYVPFNTLMDLDEKVELEDYSRFGFQRILGVAYVKNVIGTTKDSKRIKIYGNEIETIGRVPLYVIERAFLE